jgi:predicted dehydrogenase
MYNIVLIGAGNIGSRHLQGLAGLDLPAAISVLDIKDNALALARDRYNEVAGQEPRISVDYSNSLAKLPEEINLAIIATSSDRRREIAEQLLKQARVRNIIFEKVVFQSAADFTRMGSLLAKQKTKAWVNCPRRLSAFYLQLKQHLGNKPQINFILQGGEWGLGCNSIHFLDLIAFLTGGSKIENVEFSGNIVASKRPGFIEMTGRLFGRFTSGSEFTLNSIAGSNMPHQIAVVAKDRFAMIDELAGRAVLALRSEQWQRKEELFQLPFQSELTGKITRKILTDGESDLSTLAESADLHIPLLKALLKTLNRSSKRKIDRCPIT